MHFTSFAEAVAYVEGFATRAMPDPVPPRERQAARFGEMRDLLAALGNPQTRLPAVHVTGTSGKGSTATICAAILRVGGRRVGLYTNPYVVGPTERVQIDGTPIGDTEFIAAAERVSVAIDALQQARPGWQPHLKQVWVALAFTAMAHAAVEIAVIEVGMGGRFDETNVVQPIASVITTIGYDHTEFLGDTLAEIAWHKAGIIKPGIPVITGVEDPAAIAVIAHEADHAHARVDCLGQEFAISEVQTGRDGTHFTYRDEPLGTLAGLHLPLVGAFQARNAALAIRAAHVAAPDLTESQIRAGLAAAWLPGRFEVLSHSPAIVLDVAHNPQKIHALVTTLRETMAWERLWVIFGAMGSKAIAPMLAELAELNPALIVTAPHVSGRMTQEAGTICRVAEAAGIAPCLIAPDPAIALAMARERIGPNDCLLITGSLFLVSALRPLVLAGGE
jgi:dihydrofolate synthase / folylpolyglutamate synthase